MAADYSEQIPDHEKVRVVSSFIKSAPPGEFNEVFNAVEKKLFLHGCKTKAGVGRTLNEATNVRVLLDNDTLLKEGASSAFSQYNTEQFTPAKVGNDLVLVTPHGKLDGSRFLDPRGKRSFRYDHLRKEASEPQPTSVDERAEPYRAAVEKAMQTYAKDHYPNGVLTVYGSSTGNTIKLTSCIEDHKFSPQNFWNGRWRSEWIYSFSPGSSGELKGVLRVQVHYYEDGNVQLVSSKDCKESFKSGNEESTAKEFVKMVETAENDYQSALVDNYKTMSQTTFKALRRALPVTRTKVDWNKIGAYNIGSELKGK